jgi:hypothetical protein
MLNDQVTDVFCVIQDPQTKLIAAVARVDHLGLTGGKLELGAGFFAFGLDRLVFLPSLCYQSSSVISGLMPLDT